MKNLLMAPGPVPIHSKVLEVLSWPIIHHRTNEFKQILKSSLLKLKDVFQTHNPVLIIPGTGSAAMEAALVNTLSYGDEVLCIVNGKFARRWQDMALEYKLKVTPYLVENDKFINLDHLIKTLQKNNFKAVFCQAVETSTGNMFPISKIGSVIKTINEKTLFIVDGITAVGVTHINMSIPEIDVLVAGSQKAFMLPTGLSFICLSDLAWQAQESSNLPKYYFDLKQELVNNQKDQTRFSSLVPHITALNFVLNEFTGTQRTHRIEYSLASSKAFKESIKALGLELYSTQPAPSLTAIRLPATIDGLKLKSDIANLHKVIVMGGQDDLKGKIIRIGHMGYITKADYITTLTALQKSLNLQDKSFDQIKLNKALNLMNSLLTKDYHDYFNY